MKIDINEFVARSRAAQGLPPRVVDPVALQRLAARFEKRTASPTRLTVQEVGRNGDHHRPAA